MWSCTSSPTLMATSLSQKKTKSKTQEWHVSLLFNVRLFVTSLHLSLRSQIHVCISGIIYINCKSLYKHKQASLLPLWSLSPSLFIAICHCASSLSLWITDFPPSTSLVLVDLHCPVPEYHSASVNIFSSSMNCLSPIPHKKRTIRVILLYKKKKKHCIHYV